MRLTNARYAVLQCHMPTKGAERDTRRLLKIDALLLRGLRRYCCQTVPLRRDFAYAARRRHDNV